ncbi:MAG: hypothetical protein IJS71_07890 [Clostridia bacterium]|nr:hypothetical protein [Clostridia bacterium]
MNNNDFLEALSRICNDPDFDDKIKSGRRKRAGEITKVILCVVMIFAVIVAIILFGSLLLKESKPSSPMNNGEELLDTDPDTGTTIGEPVLKDSPNPEKTPGPVYTDMPGSERTPEPLNNDEWLDSTELQIRLLTYASMSADVTTLYSDNLGISHISAEVKGEHRNCPGCYYNVETGEVVCLYHEFLDISGIMIQNGCGLHFYVDRIRSDLVAVSLYDKDSILTKGLWIYDRKAGTVSETGFPEGCAGYEDLYLYKNCLWNGKLAVSVNSAEGMHCIYILSTDTGVVESVDGTENNVWSSASFIGDNLLLLTSDGYSFFNINTGTSTEVVGEFNYYTDGKVFSVKNWGWANHKEVEVAVYDTETGLAVEDQPVLVKTVLDDGTRVFLAKNTTSGEETVILDNYDQTAYVWSNDYAYFYAFSDMNDKLVCYSSANGKWISSTVPGISTEPVTIDGKEYTVHPSYALAVSDRYNEVALYYMRTFEEIHVLPEDVEEAGDSSYLDKYREIKTANFDEKDHFSIWLDRDSSGVNIKDMTWLRDVILTVLEGDSVNKTLGQYDVEHRKVMIRCGTVQMWFMEYEDVCYAYLGYNMLNPVGGRGYAEEMYEIPQAVLKSVKDFYNETYKSGEWY